MGTVDYIGFGASMIRLAINLGLIIAIEIIMWNRNPYITTLLMLISIMICDGIDSILPQLYYGWNWVKGPVTGLCSIDPITGERICPVINSRNSYQLSDKLIDTALLGIVVMLHLVRMQGFVSLFEIVFVILFVYRFIGVALFELTGISSFLVMFPNFALDNIALYLLLEYVFHLPPWILWPIMIVSIIGKIIWEYYLHIISVPMGITKDGAPLPLY